MIIKELKIFSSNLADQLAFYTQVLELNIFQKSKNSVSFKMGESILTFERREKVKPYHFAINIPAHKEKEALAWLKQRVEILLDGDHEIQQFDDWNANAVYFYDKDMNIIEFIARNNLDNATSKAFDSTALLEISEIGLPTFDIEQEFNLLNQKIGLPIYSGSLERFCAIGEETGLFICINKTLKEFWFPTHDKPYSSDFEMDIEYNGQRYRIVYENEKLEVF